MKLNVSQNGVFLNGEKIPNCSEVGIKIDPVERPEVTLRITVDEVDVQYSPELSRNEL